MGRPKENNKQITILVKETTDAVLTTISKRSGKAKGKIVDKLVERYIIDERAELSEDNNCYTCKYHMFEMCQVSCYHISKPQWCYHYERKEDES